MQRTYLSCLLLAVVGLSAPSLAAADGWYGSFLLGASNYNSQNDGRDAIAASFAQQGFKSSTTSSDNPAAFGLSFGYHLNPNFALELGYVDLGQAQSAVTALPLGNGGNNGQVDVYGTTVEGILGLPLGDRFALFGKGGFFLYGTDSYVNGNGGPQYSYNSSSTYDLGLGASFGLNEYASLRIGYTRFHRVGDPTFLGEGPVGLTYAQLIFNFGSYY